MNTTERKTRSAGRARSDLARLQLVDPPHILLGADWPYMTTQRAADLLNASLSQAQALLSLLLADGFEHDFASSHQDVLQVLALVLQAAGRADAANRRLQHGAEEETEDGRLYAALAALQALVRVLVNTSIDCSITGPGFASDNAVVLDALMLAADQVEAAQRAAQELQGASHD